MQQPPQEFVRHIGNALSHLYDPDILLRHPLLTILNLISLPNAQSALRERLIEEIEKLKPAPNIPIESRAWRIYKVLQMRYVQQIDQEQTAHQLGVSVRHLRREQQLAIQTLAGNLYELSQKTSGQNEQNRQPLDNLIEGELSWLKETAQTTITELGPLLDQVMALVRPLAQARNIVLLLDSEKDLPHIRFVPAALRQALISMTSYALHRLAVGRVTLGARPHNHGTMILVSATATGEIIPESDSARAIHHAITLLLGANSSSLLVNESPEECAIQLTIPTQTPVRVLMIDDNTDVADLFKRYTYGSPFQIDHLARPDTLFDVIDEAKPDVIILDIMIPGMDGWELLGRLRQHPKTNQTPVIICSVLPEKELAIALGASSYLSKPVSRHLLLTTLQQVSLDLI